MTAGSVVVEKKDEKRKALGRGLASLLPGPRVVASLEPRVLSREPEVPAAGLSPGQDLSESYGTRAGAPAPHDPEPDPHNLEPHNLEQPLEQISIQAVADTSASPATSSAVLMIELEAIEKNPYQTRFIWDNETLKELAASIRQNGVVQPIVVRPAEEKGRYTLVLGERRLRASKLAGKTTIPAMVRRLSLQQAAEMTVLENLQRENLNPIEQAEAFRVLSREFAMTQAEIADRVGASRETVSNYMRLLQLPAAAREYMADEQLSFSVAREILSLDDEEHMALLADEAVEKGLNLEQVEYRVRELNGFVALQKLEGADERADKRRRARWQDPNVRAAQMEMERTLGMRVKIKDRNGKGSILIEYASVDEYQRLGELLRGKKK